MLHCLKFLWYWFLVLFMILCNSVLIGLPADFHTACQKWAVSLEGRTCSLKPGDTLTSFLDSLPSGFGRVASAESWSPSRSSAANQSQAARCSSSLQWGSLHSATCVGMFIDLNLASRSCLQLSFSRALALFQDGFLLPGAASMEDWLIVIELRTQKIGEWSEVMSGWRITPASKISGLSPSLTKKWFQPAMNNCFGLVVLPWFQWA